MKHLVVISGAGISAESGLQTFRDSNGLWYGYKVEEVATIDAWYDNREALLDFYDMRRKDLLSAEPNAAHCALAKAQTDYRVSIITQNVDDLHERAGAESVLHLHGELKFCRSEKDATFRRELKGWRLPRDEKCPKGGALRPDIVWFGEEVPLMERALDLVATADACIVVGTSLSVYPAASLVCYVPGTAPLMVVNPELVPLDRRLTQRASKPQLVQAAATEGVPAALRMLESLR